MQKNKLSPLLRGLPVWLYLITALILAGLLFAVYQHLKALPLTSTSKSAGNPSTGVTLNADSQQAQSLIQNYEVNGHTINAYKNSTVRAAIYTGPLLAERDQVYESLDGTNDWIIVSAAAASPVKIVSKTDNKIIALACVSDSELELDSKGNLIQQLPTVSFAGAYVFVNIDKTWKLANFIDVTDPTKARLAYSKSSAELQALSGEVGPLLDISCAAK